MPTLADTIPVLPVRSVVASVAFYVEKLGFVVVHREAGLAILRRDAAEIHLTQLSDERWRTRGALLERPVISGAESFLAGTGACRICVQGVDELFSEYLRHGVIHPKGGLRDQAWGDRDFATLDLDGNQLTFFERRA